MLKKYEKYNENEFQSEATENSQLDINNSEHLNLINLC